MTLLVEYDPSFSGVIIKTGFGPFCSAQTPASLWAILQDFNRDKAGALARHFGVAKTSRPPRRPVEQKLLAKHAAALAELEAEL